MKIDVKKFMCYNYNQIEHIKYNCFQSNKKAARVYIIKINNNNNDNL